MFKQSLAAFGVLALLTVGLTAARASDWIDDDRTVFKAPPQSQQVPPVAPDRVSPKHLAQGSMLTGGASMTGSLSHGRPIVPTPAGTPMMPLSAGVNGAGLSAQADRFQMNASTDNTVPPERMRGWLEKAHPEFKLDAQNNPEAVVEVKGAWDDAAQILNNMGIRHDHIKPKDLREMSLDRTDVMIVNCEGKIPQDQWEKVRQWVIHGGYLITTDWTLGSFVEKAFPGMIAWNGGNTKGTTVDAIVVTRNANLMAGVPTTRGTWKLDEGSQMVRVLRPDVVHILARSNQLAQMDKNRNFTGDPNQLGVLACEFPYGRGHVLHLVGHFDYNSPMGFRRYVLPDALPGVGIGLRQAFATNFLVDGVQKSH